MPAEIYEKFFRKNYLETKVPLEMFDINNPYWAKFDKAYTISPKLRLEARDIIDTWAEKNYPETCSENVKILDNYLTLCEENEIRPVVFMSPMTQAYIKLYNRQRLEEFYSLTAQIIERHSSALFIDGWRLNFLTNADFYDVEHLNIAGAAKFSAFLNEIIEYIESRWIKSSTDF